MRMVRMSLCTGLLVACGLLVSAAERVQQPQRSSVKASLREASVEAAPDEAPLPVDDALAATAAAASACEPIGAFNNQFAGANRFRGDVFSITKQVDLVGIEMELAFRTTTDNPLELFFYVFGDSASDPATDPPIFDVVIFESTINAPGDGVPTFYESGLVEASGGAPLTLFAGKRYAIGAAWTSTSGSPSTIIYGSDGLSYPRLFVAGQVDGLVSVNQAPPLTTLGTPVVFTSSGAYSLRLCLAGACCLPVTGCENLSKFNCDSTGGDFTAGGVTCAEDINTCPLAQGACCIDGEACLVRNEFSCAANGGAWTEGVACDDPTEPCAPRGGCCLPDQSPPCTANVTETHCALLGGTYRGDGVACDASPGCGAGACCVEETCAELTRANCESQIDGLYSGPGTSCDAGICIPTGACCDGETCRDLTEEDCALVFGASFRGDGTSCGETLAPACGKGACCLPGAGCFDGGGQGVLQQFCENQNGDFRGDGTSCATISPACEGVCCLTNPSFCAVRVSPEECWFDSAGQFAGYFSDGCTSGPCPVAATSRACCLRSGGCTVTDEETCGILVGQFQVDESCDTVVCSIQGPLGVCCDPSNVCDNNSGNGKEESSCPENWIEGVVPCASPNPCLPVGACCDGTSCTGDGDNEVDCDGVNPAWIENATCLDIPDPCAPTGSCCNESTFECWENVVADACVGSLVFVQDGTCAAECTAPVGACCAIASAVAPDCSEITQADCDLVGGRYHGDTVECIDITCGACCQLSGTCQDDVVADECTDPDFDFFIVGSACVGVCTPLGACCVNGTCEDARTQLECGNASGLYAGDGTLCSGGACDVGACCGTDETCVDDVDTTRTACEAGGGRFLDAGSTCSSPTDEVCKRGVCCEPDATCTGDKIVLDCANPEEFVPGSPSCDTAGCLVRGACCLDDQPCQLSSQVTCGVSGGNFAGNGTSCETDLCTVGACCDAGSSCTESTTLSCTQSSGTYLSPGSECLSGTGPDDCSTPRGACCNGGGCLIETETSCTGGGGSYAGDNVSCDVVDLCLVGACCLSTGGCDDSATQFECEVNGGTFIGFGISCLGTADECTTGSCCGLDGTCSDGVAAEVCAAEGGSFDSFLNCIGVGSSCEVRGCCCEGGSPSIKTEAACTGTYLGDGKSCVGVDCGIGACCNGDSPCTEVSQASCAAVDDNYFGDGTTCVERGVDCSIGACCSSQEICSVTSRLNCQQSGGFPLPGGTDCASDPDICLPRGACCVDGTCNDTLTQFACGDAGGLYIGDDTLCSGGACDVGACCNGESPCADVSQASCSAAQDNYFGDGTTCAGLGVDCAVGACCSRLETCSMASKIDCETPGGIHQLGGTDCASSSCVISILSSTPDAGAIDARQPSGPELPVLPEEIVLTGWDQFDIDFTGNPFFLVPQDFVVELFPGGQGVAVPSIVDVVVTGTGAVIQLDQPIPVGHWTIIRHLSSNTITWFGNLPGDVNGDLAVVGSFEVSAMVGCLNSPGTCNLWQCDANRSNACTPADLLRLIDIISGTGAYAGLGAGSLPVFP